MAFRAALKKVEREGAWKTQKQAKFPFWLRKKKERNNEEAQALDALTLRRLPTPQESQQAAGPVRAVA